MQLREALARLETLLALARDKEETSTRPEEVAEEMSTLIAEYIAPALKTGGALPLPETTKQEIQKLLLEISKLEQNLLLKSKAISEFKPARPGQ